MQANQPLVSVVTPVYNGAKYLHECISSVLEQTYESFEYIIVNNCSTDETLTIAQSYARNDPRIKVVDSQEFVGAIDNSNRALQLISEDSVYCKVLHADDWMFPECLEKMVDVAERNGTVGVVGSYVLTGKKVRCDGLPYTGNVFSGKEVCRDRLLGGPYLFGSPSSILIRSEIVRGRTPFYAADNLHVDVAVIFDILKEWDFGFVHQVLTYTRLHEESRTATISQKMNTNRLEGLGMLMAYGPFFLTAAEFEKTRTERLEKYYDELIRAHFKLFDANFREYQRQELAKIGFEFRNAELLSAALRLMFKYTLRPVRKLRKKTHRA